MPRLLSLAISVTLLPGAALGQHEHIATAAPAGSVPLFDDLGSYHHAITTSSPEAQRYFDQGLRLLYGFNHDEAERALREAARLDPDCAMAWWGIAFALGPNINVPIDPERNTKALDAVAKAQAASGKANAREQAYVDAIAKRYSPDPRADRAALDQAFATAMGELSRAFPDDLDAATLYAEAMMDLRPWKLWNADGTSAPGTEQIVAVLESVLKRNPDHPGANHYYVHATEASPHPERALASAERLKTLVPGAGHLVHMPAHTFMRTGDYVGAVQANAIAAKVDEAYIQKSGVQGVYPLMYYNHNLHFLALAAAMAGQSAAARDAAIKVAANAAPVVKEMPMAEFLLPAPYYVALRFQRWDEVLAFPEPDGAFVATRALRHYARALARLAKGEGVDDERAAFAALRAQVPADALFNLNPSRAVLDVAAAVLDARVASAHGDAEAAIAAWRKAVEAEALLSYDEPPIWYYPVRESLGAELLRAGRGSEAEAVFRDDLAHNPKNGRSLFGLWKSLEAQEKPAAAARKEFEAAWKAADVPLRLEDL